MFRPLWIEINLKALRANFRTIRNFVGSRTKIIATVKQHAYGHGLIAVAKELSCLGVDFFGVGSIEEGIVLRDNGFKEPILVLTAVLPQFANCFTKYNITPTVVDLMFAKKLNKEAAKQNIIFPVHVKIDTGMGRLGLYYEDAHKFIEELNKFKNITLEGIFTHFPAADTDVEFTNYQISVFNRFISKINNEGIFFKYHHCANSSGLINYPDSHFNMVRPGLILYGIKPIAGISFVLQPVLSFKSRIVFIKRIRRGMGVSYGRTYIANRPTSIGTVAVGYADGYPWVLSNRGRVIIKGKIFNLVGRVCMDHIMIDLGQNKDIKVGDEVVLIGQRGSLKITAEDIANWANTIPYEIVSRLSFKIPRIYKYRSNAQDNAGNSE
jgi:alanine racemase